jgi:hypothetical protein
MKQNEFLRTYRFRIIQRNFLLGFSLVVPGIVTSALFFISEYFIAGIFSVLFYISVIILGIRKDCIFRIPSLVDCALELDTKLNLKERVTTLHALNPNDPRALFILEGIELVLKEEKTIPLNRVSLLMKRLFAAALFLFLVSLFLARNSFIGGQINSQSENLFAEAKKEIEEVILSPEVPEEVKTALEQLVQEIEADTLSQDEIKKQIQIAQSVITETKKSLSKAIAPKSLSLLPTATPTATPSPTRVVEEKNEAQKNKNDKQQEQNKDKQDKNDKNESQDNKKSNDQGQGDSSSKEEKKDNQNQKDKTDDSKGSKQGENKQDSSNSKKDTQNSSEDNKSSESQKQLNKAQNALSKLEESQKEKQKDQENKEQNSDKQEQQSDQKKDSNDKKEGDKDKQDQNNQSPKQNQGDKKESKSEGEKNNNSTEKQPGEKKDGKDSKDGEGKDGKQGTGEKPAEEPQDKKSDKNKKESTGKSGKSTGDAMSPLTDDAPQGMQPGGPPSPGLSNKSFEEKELGSLDEKLNTEFTGDDSLIKENKDRADPKTKLKDTLQTIDGRIEEKEEQPIPLEYQGQLGQ